MRVLNSARRFGAALQNALLRPFAGAAASTPGQEFGLRAGQSAEPRAFRPWGIYLR
jgi:hypothetical protein